ncbi:MAG: hypothetical protein ACREDK_07285 [Thermoplasmata archaeon]
MGPARPRDRHATAIRRSLPALAVALLLLVALTGTVDGAPARSSSSARPTAGTDPLTVTVGTAFAFTVSTDEVTPGDTVDLTLVQTDDVQHTFTLSSVAGFTFPSSDSTGDLLTYFAAHPPIVNVTIPAGAATMHATFTAPPFGEYEYVCLVSGHFQLGMYGVLGSGEHGTTLATTSGPGAPVFIIGGTIAGLVVIALVLGFVIGRRKGAVHEMSPERLGYVEVTPPLSPSAPKPSPPPPAPPLR